MLNFKNITTNEKKPHLNNLNLHIKIGEITILNYKSDVEKNKLIDLIHQLEAPKSGELFIDGKNILNSKKRLKKIQKKIGVCYGDFKLIETKNVLKNIIFPLEIYTSSSKDKLIKIGENTLKTFGLYDKKDYPLSKLTLEEKQRLNIARSMILNPDLIILDNPDRYIEGNKIDNLINYFIELNKMGKTILIFTNNKKIEQKISGNKYLLEKGAISNV
jgi:ABC-type ATPase involved in cell division